MAGSPTRNGSPTRRAVGLPESLSHELAGSVRARRGGRGVKYGGQRPTRWALDEVLEQARSVVVQAQGAGASGMNPIALVQGSQSAARGSWDLWGGFSLADPQFLLLVPLALVLFLFGRARRGRARGRISVLAARPAQSWRQRLGWLPSTLQLFALACAAIALARPLRGNVQRDIVSEGVDIILAVDRSSSMKFDDLEPQKSRLEVVKDVVGDFAERRMTDREGAADNVALLTFARYPELLCPFTLDVDALQGFLEDVEMAKVRGEDGTGYRRGPRQGGRCPERERCEIPRVRAAHRWREQRDRHHTRSSRRTGGRGGHSRLHHLRRALPLPTGPFSRLRARSGRPRHERAGTHRECDRGALLPRRRSRRSAGDLRRDRGAGTHRAPRSALRRDLRPVPVLAPACHRHVRPGLAFERDLGAEALVIGFDFLRPQLALLLLLSGLVLVVGLYGVSRRRADLRRLVERPALARFAPGLSWRRSLLRLGFASLGLLLLALSAIGPVRGYTERQAIRRGLDLVLCLDTSRSMLAQDLRPSRLERARREVLGLLEELSGDRVALIAFSGDAREVAPLTHDRATLASLLDYVRPEDNRLGGTNLAAALEQALSLFDGRTGSHEAIVLLTDGEDLEGRGAEVAQAAADRGIRVYVVGLGTEGGAKIPVRNAAGGEGFVTGPDGAEVVTKLDGSSLERLARATGGDYLSAENSPTPLEDLYRTRISRLEGRDLEEGLRRVPHDRYQWPLVLGMLCMLAETGLRERRGRDARKRS